jgi:hypothetical protein
MHRLFTPLLFTALSAMAQNAPPTVTITDVQLDEGAGIVAITYDLSDAEETALHVSMRVSMDEGVTFIEGPLQATGDLGAGVPTGMGRTIQWNYGELPGIQAAMVQLIAWDEHVPDIQQMVDQVDTDLLMQRLQQISIPRHHTADPEGLQQVRDLVLSSFQQNGLITTTHTASHQGHMVDNLLGRQTGMTDPVRTYIVDGHYDAVVNTPGADDNGTAVAAMLEIAKILSTYTFRHSLRYIGFAFEEQGLIGSMQYVQNGMPPWEQVHGVLNMEMIGYYSDQPQSQSMPQGFEMLFPQAAAELQANEFRGDFLTIVGNTASDALNDAFAGSATQYVPQLRTLQLSVPGNGLIAPDLRRSDHAPFWDAGIPALMLTDGSNYRNPHYHLPSDVVSTIDPQFFANSTRAVLAAAATLAEPLNAGLASFSLSTIAGIHTHDGFPCTAEVVPNPARDHINIKLSGCAGERISAELFDLKGIKLKGMMVTSGDQVHRMPVQDIPAGIYLLVLRAGEDSHTLKVELER